MRRIGEESFDVLFLSGTEIRRYLDACLVDVVPRLKALRILLVDHRQLANLYIRDRVPSNLGALGVNRS